MKTYRMILTGTLLLLTSAFPLRSHAQEESEERFLSLTVITTDGHTYGVNLTEQMTGSFDSEANFLISAPEFNPDGSQATDEENGSPIYKTYVTIPGIELKGVTLSKELAGVRDTDAACDFDISYDFQTSKLSIAGAEGKQIAICAADGHMEYSATTEAAYIIDLSRFGSGIQIVKIDSTTFKLLVK